MKDTKLDYGFYSNVLKKPFTTLEELRAAEEEFNKLHAEEIRKAEEKKAKAKEIEDALKETIKAREDADAILKEAQTKARQLIIDAEKKYNQLKKEFIETYGSYHMTYYKDDNKENISITDIINMFGFGTKK